MKLTILLGLTLVTVSGCVPLPHRDQWHPEIDGVVMTPQGPANSWLVGLQGRAFNKRETDCSKFPKTVRTDSLGRFHFDAGSTFALFFMMGDRFDTWEICVQGADSKFSWRGSGAFGGPRHQQLNCNTKEATCTAQSSE